MKVIVSPSAKREIDNIFVYISNVNSVEIATKVITRITSTIDNLALYANLGASVKSRFDIETDYKFIVLAPYPYLLFYKIKADTITVGYIIDGRRDYIRLLNL
jgi:plasmid stabilization system protein ParE